MKKILFVVHHAPVGTIWVNEAFRTALGMYAGDDLEPSVLLLDRAVAALNAALAPDKVGLLPCSLAQKQLNRFGTQLYAVKEDLSAYRVENLDEGYPVTLVSKEHLSKLFHEHNFVIWM
ncbi:uncharacterized protein involved in the oxidation of intracellular sulfur-like protein [Spirochaeta thermophila DSM 6578]|uniref:Uncharacterized protein involved in the oxidation of intracellular sulfur-like protein n=1 Tax=Winmispira thermophila (strain ATCC 700085 / DSM 6578 / Z-1203) TaxID=869211 RepID=G0GAP4_WINT7|nr:DsrE family protein [Spirochaeta thermophila]AEJ61009.1 uncharacterized protein involved in the oxidation of intracellular sulfur-like protein [Spirochaeta thermophila DSM 6578]